MTHYLDEANAEVARTIESGDKLDRVRNAVRRLRDLEFEKAELEERLSAIKNDILVLEQRDLVSLFSEVHVTSVSLEAEGNLPAVVADRVPFYSAKIPPEKEAEAFNWFNQQGHGDLIKTEIKVSFGMGDRTEAEQVETMLEDAGVEYSSKLGVHPSTLKAFVKAEIESGHALPMELLGAYAGEVVKIKEKKK